MTKCVLSCPPRLHPLCLPPQADVQAQLDAAIAEGRAARATVTSRATGAAVSVVLRPGCSDQLAPSKAVGIPNWVPSEKDPQAGCHAGR